MQSPAEPITASCWQARPLPSDPGRKPYPLPMSRHDMDALGWDACDAILVTGDAYVDHPSFGAAMVGRFLDALGYRVGILAQPDTADPAAFLALGAPRLFWGVTAGNVDSQLSTLTVMRKRRSDDPYSPGGHAGRRPPNATIVYASRAREAARGVPVVIGGIEASLRRFPYYDYWTDKVRRSLIFDAKADWLVFGMAERALAALAAMLREGRKPAGIPGSVEIRRSIDGLEHPVILPPYETVSEPSDNGRNAFVEMTRTIFNEHHPSRNRVLVQQHGDRWLVAHPPAKALSTEELDWLYALPFTRRPHPSYGRTPIPAYDMIRDSVTTHRGCYASCAFCAIGMHQGAAVTSRSETNISAEIERLAAQPHFHGTVSDLGGPTANMYGTRCGAGRPGCTNRNCLTPAICANLVTDHAPLLRLMKRVRSIPRVRHAFVGSGIRFDLAMAGGGRRYIEELVRDHVSGRLKIAPEHVSDDVLRIMRKPSADSYARFVSAIREASRVTGQPCPIVEYFISGHPGCTLQHMVELAEYLHRNNVKPEQVQDFYPAPLTLAAAMFYTGVDPLTGETIHVARTDREKALQRALLLYHKPEFHRKARQALREAGRPDLIGRAPNCLVPPGP